MRKYTIEDVVLTTEMHVADEDQTSLIMALKQRDRSAWSVAVDRHLREVYGFVFHLVGGDQAVAEDLNQESWLEALNGIDQCDATRGSFRNWLFGIARRRVAMYYRRRPMTGNPTSLSSPFGEVAGMEDLSVFPEEMSEQVEKTSAVRAAIIALPDDRREVLLKKYVDGLSTETIATHMGRTVKAVESLLSRTRKQMRVLLRGYMIPCGDVRRVSKESSNE